MKSLTELKTTKIAKLFVLQLSSTKGGNVAYDLDKLVEQAGAE